jgi:hypothetical protein
LVFFPQFTLILRRGWSGKSIILHDNILARVLEKMIGAGLLIRGDLPEGLLFVDATGCRVSDGAGLLGGVGLRSQGDHRASPDLQPASWWPEGNVDRYFRLG